MLKSLCLRCRLSFLSGISSSRSDIPARALSSLIRSESNTPSQSSDKRIPNPLRLSAELQNLVPKNAVPIAHRRVQMIKFRQRSDYIVSELRRVNPILTSQDYSNLLKGYGYHRDFQRLQAIWLEFRSSGLPLSTEVYNAYLFALCGYTTRRLRKIASANAKRLMQLVEEIEADQDARAVPNGRTYMLLMSIFRNARETKELLEVLETKFGITKQHLLGRHPLPTDTYYPLNMPVLNAALSALGHLNMFGAMTNLFLNMSGSRSPDLISYQTVSRHLIQYYRPRPVNAADTYGSNQVPIMAEFAGAENVHKLILPSAEIQPADLVKLPTFDIGLFKPWLKLFLYQKQWGRAKELINLIQEDCGIQVPRYYIDRVETATAKIDREIAAKVRKQEDEREQAALLRAQSEKEPETRVQGQEQGQGQGQRQVPTLHAQEQMGNADLPALNSSRRIKSSSEELPSGISFAPA